MITPLSPGGFTGKLAVIQVGIGATFCQKLSEDKAPINFNTASNHYHYKGGRTTNARRDYRGQIEYFAVYSPDLDKVYLVPVDHVGTTNAYLRLAETANKQKKGVRWAKDHEL